MKIQFLRLIFTFVTLFVCEYMYAKYDFAYNDLYYEIVNDSEVILVRGDSAYAGNFSIPSVVSYKGKSYTVISVDERAFGSCRGLLSVTIPNTVKTIGEGAFIGCTSLKTITIPASVISIGEWAFSHCTDMTTVKVDANNKVYDSRDNCNGIIETKTNTLIAGFKTTVIPGSVTSIGYCAFYRCYTLKKITIPPYVTSIGKWAFGECSALESIISEIQKPFPIEDVFYHTLFSSAKLSVPNGTKKNYQSTAGWKDFQNIVEYASTETVKKDDMEFLCNIKSQVAELVYVPKHLKLVVVPSSVKGSNGNYVVNKIADYTFKDCDINHLSLPETISTLSDYSLADSKICALTWNSTSEVPASAFKYTKMSTDYNFLLYVNSASVAPHTVKNVIVNKNAESIILSDKGDSYFCPVRFVAKKITYSHRFSMQTGGNGKGWETIVLPFTVQTIMHSSKGELTPFASWEKSSTKKPFWLYTYNQGLKNFSSSSTIIANIPYLIAMPNQDDYESNYNLDGDVTFSADNVSIEVTPSFNSTFVPTYAPVQKSASVYAINAVNTYLYLTGGKDAGSCFISNLRDIRPFEAYIVK